MIRTVALLVYPNQEIFAVNDLLEPQEPPHSGYINEEVEMRKNYYAQLRAYKERVQSATRCNQEIAKQVLLEQFPDRDMNIRVMEHYNVKNILISELINKRRKNFTVNEEVTCINRLPLPGNSVSPPLEEGKKYKIIGIVLDHEGNQHLDVGLKSEYNFITSYETGVELPDGDKIHWCHPTRFE